jgi:hypothetical protein
VTKRKSDIRPKTRAPEFVDRETGAGELCISPETWDKWVEDGALPPPEPGFPDTSPRWEWDRVKKKLRGIVDLTAPDKVQEAAERLRHGAKASGKRRAA